MSNWTHVAGVIRIDSFRFSGDLPDFDKLIGKECLFESPMDVWKDADKNPKAYLPIGSEGSLQKSIWVNPDSSHMAAYTVAVFGDLRDHHDPDEIIVWFKDKCKFINDSGAGFIRQATVTVDNELEGNRTWTYE